MLHSTLNNAQLCSLIWSYRSFTGVFSLYSLNFSYHFLSEVYPYDVRLVYPTRYHSKFFIESYFCVAPKKFKCCSMGWKFSAFGLTNRIYLIYCHRLSAGSLKIKAKSCWSFYSLLTEVRRFTIWTSLIWLHKSTSKMSYIISPVSISTWYINSARFQSSGVSISWTKCLGKTYGVAFFEKIGFCCLNESDLPQYNCPASW